MVGSLWAEAPRDILKLSLGNGVSRGFQDVFSTMDAMYTCTTGNNAVEMSQAFHNITQFECFTDRNPFKICVQCHSKLGNICFTILFEDPYFWSAVIVEGNESSQLRMANYPAVLAGYWPSLTDLSSSQA